ncbi:OmpA family protein [Vibrionales bacterium C3R12]|nr:OmpA family protein [Vibrionales bacterium C3R12]
MIRKLATVCILLSTSTSTLTHANNIDNQALSYYCGGDKVEYEKNISVGKGTRVILNEGPFYQIEQTGEYDPTLDFINKQVVSSGVSSDCSEFLLANGQFKPINDGGVIARVYFDFNKSTLTDKSKYVLDNIQRMIKNNNQNLNLEGHTDSVGSKAYNFSLGLKRSKAVEEYLVKKGISKNALSTSSKGENEPLVSNDTAKDRDQNRRVEIQ